MGQVVRFLMIFDHESEDLPVPPILLLGFYQQKSGVFLPSRSGIPSGTMGSIQQVGDVATLLAFVTPWPQVIEPTKKLGFSQQQFGITTIGTSGSQART
jgi:hypothetical protein